MKLPERQVKLGSQGLTSGAGTAHVLWNKAGPGGGCFQVWMFWSQGAFTACGLRGTGAA